MSKRKYIGCSGIITCSHGVRYWNMPTVTSSDMWRSTLKIRYGQLRFATFSHVNRGSIQYKRFLCRQKSQWLIQGRIQGTPLLLDETEAQRAEKTTGRRPAPAPPYLGVWMTPNPPPPRSLPLPPVDIFVNNPVIINTTHGVRLSLAWL